MLTTTRIELRRAAGGRPVLDLDAGHLRPFVLADDAGAGTGAGAGTVSVAVVPAVAMLLAGDDVRLQVVVGAGCRLRIVEPAGTVAYHMRGGSAVRSLRVEVGPDATLVWEAQPLVVADGARLELDSVVEVAAGGRVLLRESLVFGRSGETGGDLLTRTRATVAGRPALVEELDLGRAARADPIVLGGHRCMDTMTALGWRLPGTDPALLQLHAPGSVHRVLAGDLPASPLPALFAAAARSLASEPPSAQPSRAEPVAGGSATGGSVGEGSATGGSVGEGSATGGSVGEGSATGEGEQPGGPAAVMRPASAAPGGRSR